MKYVSLPDDTYRQLPFYLMMEEYLAREYPDEREMFFMWQVKPTVIFGRNQMFETEVNIDFCREQGIEMYRRKSGGGCVYADLNNIMFSYLTSSDDVTGTFAAYTSRIAAMLRSLGIPAEAGTRNDILINGHKVSGNAFYHLPGRSIVHGTMLYDADRDTMDRVITPSPTKLTSKGVRSVHDRVTTIREHSDISLDEFKRYVRDYLCDGEMTLTSTDTGSIDIMSRHYFTESWIHGNNPRGIIHNTARIEGVGEFQVYIAVDGGLIKTLDLRGDYFIKGDIDSLLLWRLWNVPYDRESVAKALKEADMEEIIPGLTKEQFADMLF
ncbi:MAG: hypothetical protein NC117_02990 [Pseudoflavonifractor sp.]|nr:hypothetical protein [Pseudoflavonifractor sp.]